MSERLLSLVCLLLVYTVLKDKILQRFIKLTESKKKKKSHEGTSGFNQLSALEISLPQLRVQVLLLLPPGDQVVPSV